MAMLGLEGVTAIETRVAPVTVSTEAGLVTPLIEAVMFVVPGFTAVAKPVEVMVAVAGVAEFQVAVAVMSCVVESL